MANPIKGEVAFEAGGAGYKLVLNAYGLASAERHLGRALPAVLAEGAIGFDVLLALLYGGLLKHHDLTVRQAAEVMDALGMERTGEVVTEALSLAFPDAVGKGAANPPKAAATI